MLGYDEDEDAQESVWLHRIDKTEVIEELKLSDNNKWKA